MNSISFLKPLKHLVIATFSLGLIACGSQATNASDSVPVKSEPTTAAGMPIVTKMKNYIFGHSLVNHTPPAIPTPSNETSVPHWMKLLSKASGFGYTVDGQYGFLQTHTNLPPTPQWGFDIAKSGWRGSFASSNFTTILLTPANFIQYQPADVPYDGDNPKRTTPIQATLTVVDWVTKKEPDAIIYIYESWPDMASYIPNFPPSAQDFTKYNNYTNNEFHDWWINYQDAILSARPNAKIKMLPIGPIISKLLLETDLGQIPVTELYEDAAPHGRPTIYFLASLVTFMGTYGVQPELDFKVPKIVHPLVKKNYASTVSFIWKELQNFNDSQGNSRIW